MTDDEPDIAEFQLYIVKRDGAEELVRRTHGERAASLMEMVACYRQARAFGDRRRVYEVALIPVDMGILEGDGLEPSRLILPPGVQ